MSLLTDNECRDIYNGAMAMPERSVVQTMRVVEAAVLAKLSAGYPCVLLKDGPTYTLDFEQLKEILSSVSKAAYAAGAATRLGADNAGDKRGA